MQLPGISSPSSGLVVCKSKAQDMLVISSLSTHLSSSLAELGLEKLTRFSLPKLLDPVTAVSITVIISTTSGKTSKYKQVQVNASK